MNKLKGFFMNLLSAVTPAKNVQYFTGLLIFLQFDKCDVISHLHTVTGRNLTGQFFNRPITVALFELILSPTPCCF